MRACQKSLVLPADDVKYEEYEHEPPVWQIIEIGRQRGETRERRWTAIVQSGFDHENDNDKHKEKDKDKDRD